MNPIWILFHLACLLQPQATKPAPDPATALSRAKLALESGDLLRAEALLTEALGSNDPAVSAEARTRLSELEGRLGKGPVAHRPGADSPIAVRVRDAVQKLEREPSLAKEAIEEITWIGESAVPFLGGWIDDPSISTATRDALVQAAASIGGEANLALLERLADSPDELLRRKAMEHSSARANTSPARFPEGRWISVASRFLGDSDPRTREQALIGLKRFPAEVRDRVVPLARDPDPRVRETLVKYFFPILPEQAREALLADAATSVRRTMAESLGRREWGDARTVALRLLKDSDSDVRKQALNALGRASSPQPADLATNQSALAPLVLDPSADVRGDLPAVARRLLGAAAVPLLLPLLLDEHSGVANAAMTQLGAVPRGELRREDLPKLFEMAPAIVRRYGWIDPSTVSGPTITASGYVRFLAERAPSVCREGDFPLVAKAYAGMPGFAARDRGTALQLLRVASPADVPALCDLYEKLPDTASRAAILQVLSERVGELGEAAGERVVPLLATALGTDADAELRPRALVAALELKAPGLGPAMTEALRTLPENQIGTDIPRLIGSFGKKAPREAAECFVALASREIQALPGDSPIHGIQRGAVEWLAGLPIEVSLPALRRLFQGAPSYGVRIAVVERFPADPALAA
ncbi:MAG TPA: HEAT repeat domain-containing protein, partial [Planctomycetota bacterium]|nr:HEAT repeat domain-containing protein [Planctomycetota bacterium]